MDLIQSMLQLDPIQRPSMAEVQGHPWVQGETLSPEEVFNEITERRKAVLQGLAQEEQEKAADKQRRAELRREGVRGADDEDLPEDLLEELAEPSKPLKVYDPEFAQTTEVFSSHNPDVIEKQLLHKLNKAYDIEVQPQPDKYKLRFTVITR